MKCRSMNVGLRMFLEQANHSPVAAYNAALLLEAEHRGQAAVQYFYARAANGGYVPAMLKIAGFLISGQYVDYDNDTSLGIAVQNTVQGAAWIQSAAKTGDSTANYLLARCYWDGIGVERSRPKAMYYLNQVVFPECGMNPYEPTEAFVFGGISMGMKANVSRIQKMNSLTPAG